MWPRPRLKKKGKNSPRTMGQTKQNQTGGLLLTAAINPLLIAAVATPTRSPIQSEEWGLAFCTQHASVMGASKALGFTLLRLLCTCSSSLQTQTFGAAWPHQDITNGMQAGSAGSRRARTHGPMYALDPSSSQGIPYSGLSLPF